MQGVEGGLKLHNSTEASVAGHNDKLRSFFQRVGAKIKIQLY